MRINLKSITRICSILLLSSIFIKNITGNNKIFAVNFENNMERGKNENNPIKILEIEPADTFKLTKTGGVSIDPMNTYKNQIIIPKYENTQVNGKYVSIEHITMAEFISRVDEISGQYDAVVIGRENRMVERQYDGGNHRFFDYILTEHSQIRKYREYTNPYEQLHLETVQNVLNEYKENEVEYISENDITDKRAEEIKKMYYSNQLVYMDRNIGINEPYKAIVKYKYSDYNDETLEEAAINKPIDKTKLYKLYNELSDSRKFSKTGDLIYYDPTYAEKLNVSPVPTIEDDITIERIINDYEELENQNKRPNVISHEKIISDRKLKIKVKVFESTEMDFKLYIDKDGDGLYKTEKEVVPIEVEKIADENKYKEYEVTYNIDNDFWGYLGWKLEVQRKGNNSIKTNIVDFDTVVSRPNNLDKKEINILQLDVRNWQLDDISKSQSFRNLINQISNDYKINFERMSIQDFNINRATLDNYDGIIIGFGNNNRSDWNYQLSLESIEKLKNYMNSGKSVVFTSDTMANTSDIGQNQQKNDSTSSLTQAFRDMIGQSRYIDPYNPNEKDLDGSTTIAHDILPVELNNKYSAGITLGGNSGGWIVNSNSKIINRSQNTNYPFKLGDTIQLGQLDRSQLYQLNLEDEDVVPLYNIVNTNGNYINDSDSRNYYHTYSKGNITYISTLPNYNNEFPEDELKLFINSLIKKSSNNINNSPIINSVYTGDKISNGDIIELKHINGDFTFTTEADDKDNDEVKLEVILNEDNTPIKTSNGFVQSVDSKLNISISENILKEAYLSDNKKIKIIVKATDKRGAESQEQYFIDLSKVSLVEEPVHGIYMGIANGDNMIDTSNQKIFPKGSAITFGAYFNGVSNGQTITLKLGKDLVNDTSYLASNPKMYAINSNNELIYLNVELSPIDNSNKTYSESISSLPDECNNVLVIYTQVILEECDNYINIIGIDTSTDDAKVKISSELPDLF